MSPELTLQLKESALASFSRVTHPEFGIVATPEGYRFYNFFARDAMRSGMAMAPRLEPQSAPLVIPYIIRSQEVAIANIGKKDNPITGEKADLLPHEHHNRNSPQHRLIELEKDHPVKINPDGSRELTTWFADDVNSLFRSCVAETANALERLEGLDVANEYRRRMWPYVVRTLRHDIEVADLDGDGLIESMPKGKNGHFINPTWKDSGDAYIDEDGRLPTPPYKYLTNNSDFLHSLDLTAQMAAKLGYSDVAGDLRNRYLEAQRRIHEIFWMEKYQYMAPLIEGTGEQVQFIGDDVVHGLYGKIFYPEYARLILARMKKPDMLTDWGPRTRSSQSRQFSRTAYQRGAVWGHITNMAAEGAENYGDYAFAEELDNRSAALELREGPIELIEVYKNGHTKKPYKENGHPAACEPQAWAAATSYARRIAHYMRLYSHIAA